MHAPAMHWFGSRLAGAGFAPRALGYYSVIENTDKVTARIADALRAAPGAHVVAHSLGGLLALKAMHGLPPERVGRVVCLGTPLAGSAAADGVRQRVPGGGRIIGQHLQLLLDGAGALPAGVEIGEIAGDRPMGLGGWFARFDTPHDGTVCLAETRLPGLCDHVVIASSHSGLMFSPDAVRHTIAFLREGRFEHEAQAEAGRAIA